MWLRKLVFVAEMNGIVSFMRYADQKLGIYDRTIPLDNVINRHWVHVVNKNLIIDLMIWNRKITAKISGNNMLSDLTPLS